MNQVEGIVTRLLEGRRRIACELVDPIAWEVTGIVDTRDWETIEGMFRDMKKPIRGSGSASECDLCGAGHEVHVTLTNRTSGKKKVVGTSCALQAGIQGAARKIKKFQTALKAEAMDRIRQMWRDDVSKLWPNPGTFLEWLKKNDRDSYDELRRVTPPKSGERFGGKWLGQGWSRVTSDILERHVIRHKTFPWPKVFGSYRLNGAQFGTTVLWDNRISKVTPMWAQGQFERLGDPV